jgi:addiction module HigA family antidote
MNPRPLEYSQVKKKPTPKPVHPGAHIRAEILNARGLNVSTGALALGVTRAALSNLLNGNANLSGEMALRIEQAFGVPMEPLMRMQAEYDIAITRARESSIKVPRFRMPSGATMQALADATTAEGLKAVRR